MTQQDTQKKKHILLLVGLLFSVGVAIILNRVPFIRNKSDIHLRWYATAQLFAEDRNLYDERNGLEVAQIVYGGDPIHKSTNYYYPAHLLIFTGPLALLSYPTAHLVWTTAVQLFYLYALWQLIQNMQWPVTINQITLFLVAAVLFLPSLQHTIWGQFNTIGVLSFALSYLALRQEKYGWAGIWATGLTFKPQATFLLLAFLLLWSLWQRRWRFILGFALTGIGLWAVAEIFQPGWVFKFIDSLSGYIPLSSVLDQIWNPYQLVAGGLLVVTALIFVKNRNMAANSLAFAGCLSLSVAAWMLVMPLVGMMHTVILPPVLILILAGLQRSRPNWYRPALLGLTLVYIGGWAVFLWGLFDQTFYDQHILWSEFAYKAILPIFIIALSAPFCMRGRFRSAKL